jgi:prophage regulatory protein
MQEIPSKDKLTRQEAADFLSVSIFTLNKWASEAKGPRSIKVGRQSVYRLADLEAFKASRDGHTSEAQRQPQASGLPAGAYIMRMREVMRLTGLAKSTVYDLMRAGTFPASISLGARAVGWPSHLVEQWVADRINAAKEVA